MCAPLRRTHATGHAPQLAEAIGVQSRTARRLLAVLGGLGFVERVPNDPVRKRYRIADRGRLLGGMILLATQTVEHHSSEPPSTGRGPTVRTLIRVLQAIAEEPRSGVHLAENLGVSRRNAQKMVAALTRLRIIERVPNDPILKRQRIASGGRELGALLLISEQDVEPYRFNPSRH